MAQKSRELPVVPFWAFLKAMEPVERIVFGVLFLVLIGLGVGTWMGYTHPDRWVVETGQVSDSVRDPIMLEKVTANYRTLDLMGEAYRSTMIYTASPMIPQPWIIWVLILGQALAWALMLAGATHTKNEAFTDFWLFRWKFTEWFPFKNFIFYFALFLFVIFMLFANPGSVWEETDLSRLISLGLSLPVVGVALLFQFRILKWSLVTRLLVFLVLTGGLAALLFFTDGFQGIHAFTANSVPFLIVMVILFLFWTGTDLTNALYLATTNAENKKLRLPWWGTLSIFLVLFLVEFALMHNALGLGWFGFIPYNLGIRPMHLVLAASALTVITSQNIWARHKKFYESPSGFTFAVLGLAIFSLSTLFSHFAMGEYLFIHAVERIAALFYTAMGLFHVIFLHLNFFPLMKRKVNFYFLTKMPREVDFFFVIILTIMVSISLEAKENMKTVVLSKSVIQNRLADKALTGNDLEGAFKHYSRSRLISKGGIKSNYNYVMARLTQYPEQDTLIKYFSELEKAEKFKPFPPASINQANILLLFGQQEEARKLYEKSIRRRRDHRTFNNLAMLELKAGLPDSAIAHLKTAILLAPEASGPYANLSQVYQEYGFEKEMREFIQAAMETPHPSAVAVTNALYQNLYGGDSIAIPEAVWEDPELKKEEAAQYNYILNRYIAGDFATARERTDSLLARAETPEGFLLDGMLKAREDSFEVAFNRIKYLETFYPARVSYGHHFLAMEFFRQNVPEMASVYFMKSDSAEGGVKGDSLNHARMELDLGNFLPAMQLFGEVRVHNYKDPEIPLAVSRELGIMHKGLGNWLQAGLEWDFEGVTAEDYLRMGRIAAMNGDLRGAQNLFQELVTLDDQDLRPYLEMGRLSLAVGDSLALPNLQAGLQQDPENIPLKIELIRAHLQNGNLPQAIGLREEVRKVAPESWRFQLADAEVSLVQGDTTGIQAKLEGLHANYPLNKEIMKTLGDFYRSFELDFEGFYVFYNATVLNKRNPDLWYYLAGFKSRLGQTEDAGYCALQAIQFEPNEQRKIKIGEEFEKEIAIFAGE